MGFDVEGARKEGYDDSQIAEFLAKQNRFNLQGARKEGYSDADIVSHLSGQVKKSYAHPPVKEQDTSLMGGLKTAGLSLIAPGGLSRVTEGATKDLESGAYRAGGAVSDIATKAGASPEVAAGAGTVANVGIQSLPMLAGGEVGKGASPAFRAGARDLMQSALKPTLKAMETGKAATAIDTMLKEGLNVSKGGVEALRGKIDQLNKQIKGLISESTTTVNKASLRKFVDETLSKFKNQVNPQADTAAIEKAWTDFKNHPELKKLTEIPVQKAQEMKQGTYKVLAGKYGEQGSASTEAQKSLARGLKEGVAQAVPAVRPLNAQESKLLDTLGVVERRMLYEANKNPMGLALLAKNPEAWAGFMADRSALFKSLVARMLNAGSEAIPASAGRVAGGAAGIPLGMQNDQQFPLKSVQ